MRKFHYNNLLKIQLIISILMRNLCIQPIIPLGKSLKQCQLLNHKLGLGKLWRYGPKLNTDRSLYRPNSHSNSLNLDRLSDFNQCADTDHTITDIRNILTRTCTYQSYRFYH